MLEGADQGMDQNSLNRMKQRLESKTDDQLLGIYAEELLGISSAEGEIAEVTKSLLMHRGIDPENWKELLSHTSRTLRAKCRFYSQSPIKGIRMASMTGEGQLEIKDGVAFIHGYGTPSLGRKFMGAVYSVCAGAALFIFCGLIEGLLTGASFGFGTSGIVFFFWWNFCKGDATQEVSHLAQKRVVLICGRSLWGPTREYCLELDSGLWTSFCFDNYEASPSIYPTSRFLIFDAHASILTLPTELQREYLRRWSRIAIFCGLAASVLMAIIIGNICNGNFDLINLNFGSDLIFSYGSMILAAAFGFVIYLAVRKIRKVSQIKRNYNGLEVSHLFKNHGGWPTVDRARP
jgi:hypothetical protein